MQVVLKGDDEDHLVTVARAAAILAFGWAGWQQGRALRDPLRVGYLGDKLTGPENPSKLGEFILGKDEWETFRLIGAYYAKGYTDFYELSEKLGVRVGTASIEFRKSLRSLFIGLILLVAGLWGPVCLVLFIPRMSTSQSSDQDQPANAPAEPSSQPAATPTANPLLDTPTPGESTTRDNRGGVSWGSR